MREVEVKIAVADPDVARATLGRSGAVARTPRYFEDNRIYDDQRGSLRSARRLLRLRTIGNRHLLTFKRPADPRESERQYKVRIEQETLVDDPGVMEEILDELGFRVVYRYQKFRQRYRLGDHSIELDETPIGSFLEIEGEPEGIDDAARILGFATSEYITKTYRALHQESTGEEDPGDLVFKEEDVG